MTSLSPGRRNITLDNRTVVNNLGGGAIMKIISVKLKGKEIFSLGDADIYVC